MPPKFSGKRKFATSKKFTARKRSAKHKTYRKTAYKKKRSYKKKASSKGLPKASARTSGTWTRPVLQSAKSARKAHIQLETRWGVPYTLAVNSGIGSTIGCFFFCNNSVGTTSWTSLFGDNNAGLDGIFAGASQAAGAPRGLRSQLYAFFENCQVLGSDFSIRWTKVGAQGSNTDVVIWFALTPLTYQEAQKLLTTSAWSTGMPGAYGTAVPQCWNGSGSAAQWETCINTAGTRYGHIGYNNGGSSSWTGHMKHNQNYFNTNPMWSASGGTICQATTQNLSTGYTNMYALTFYVPVGSTTTTATFEVDIRQKWFVRAWEPIPSALITAEEKDREDFMGNQILSRGLPPTETKDIADVDTQLDEFVELKVATPPPPTSSSSLHRRGAMGPVGLQRLAAAAAAPRSPVVR